jgi:plasmid stability protein
VLHQPCVVKNVTISLDEEVARWARIWAAEHETSVSRFVGELLRQRMEAEQGYQAAMGANLARPPVILKKDGGYPERETLHDRPLLRR